MCRYICIHMYKIFKLRDNEIYSLSIQVRDERFEGKLSEACKIQ